MRTQVLCSKAELEGRGIGHSVVNVTSRRGWGWGGEVLLKRDDTKIARIDLESEVVHSAGRAQTWVPALQPEGSKPLSIAAGGASF